MANKENLVAEGWEVAVCPSCLEEFQFNPKRKGRNPTYCCNACKEYGRVMSPRFKLLREALDCLSLAEAMYPDQRRQFQYVAGLVRQYLSRRRVQRHPAG